jgi:hypothetical protein
MLIHIGLCGRNSLALEIFLVGLIVATDIGDILSWVQENSFLLGRYRESFRESSVIRAKAGYTGMRLSLPLSQARICGKRCCGR